MQDPSDYQLDHADSPHPPPPPRRPRLWPWMAGLAVLVIAIVAVVLLRNQGPVAPSESLSLDRPDTPAAQALPPGVLGAPADPVDVPPLDESDDLVRTLVAMLSSHPRLAQWLATDDLIRTFTVTVENIAAGETPSVHLAGLRPAQPFTVLGGEDLVVLVDPRSYDRYSEIADVFASIDALGAARLYTILRPRITQAYRELGHPDSFDRALERAIVTLLAVPVPARDTALVPHGAVYQFADASLEGLNGAQKQLLRMGPQHVRTVQAQLRELAEALGIPPSRLPV